MTFLQSRDPQAVAATNRTNTFQRYIVYVTGIDTTRAGLKGNDPRGLAQTVDTFGRHRQIGVSSVVGSGCYPQVGETWVVDQSLGTWTFLSRQVAATPNVVDFMTLAQALDQLGLVAYAGPVKPPPVTSGTGVQTFVDANGDSWVAKVGVNKGAWKRAKDVLHARVFRAASWNCQQSDTVMTWDTANYDAYGLWNGGTGLIARIAGLWRYDTTVSVTYGAQNYSLWLQPRLNGTRIDFATTGPSAGGWQSGSAHGMLKMNAGDVFTVTTYTSQAQTTGGGGNDLTHAELHYIGTG